MPHIPVHPSAEKRFRQSLKRQLRNRAIKTRVRTATKGALEAIAGSDQAAAATALSAAMKILDKAATKGTIPKNTASRKIARLSKRFQAAHGTAKAQA
ncbi:MAG TPA: 30S ribosomal protein S20 [Candidatus Binataceae bacterium]|jgi:small subunit ribosomal protein S20|nr:30S ribosomal protein S20 [Candidatus Binataceae bacterium]